MNVNDFLSGLNPRSVRMYPAPPVDASSVTPSPPVVETVAQPPLTEEVPIRPVLGALVCQVVVESGTSAGAAKSWESRRRKHDEAVSAERDANKETYEIENGSGSHVKAAELHRKASAAHRDAADEYTQSGAEHSQKAAEHSQKAAIHDQKAAFHASRGKSLDPYSTVLVFRDKSGKEVGRHPKMSKSLKEYVDMIQERYGGGTIDEVEDESGGLMAGLLSPGSRSPFF